MKEDVKDDCPSCHQAINLKDLRCEGCGLELRYARQPPPAPTGHPKESPGRPEFYRRDCWSPPYVPFKTSYISMIFYLAVGLAISWVVWNTMPYEWRLFFGQDDGSVEVILEP